MRIHNSEVDVRFVVEEFEEVVAQALVFGVDESGHQEADDELNEHLAVVDEDVFQLVLRFTGYSREKERRRRQ